MIEETTEYEREQMRKFATFKGIALVILRKWLWLLLLVFTVLSMTFSLYIINHYANSINRYSATTRLMYTPRSTAKVESMNDKHLIGILDRASLKRRVGTMMEMSDDQRMCLVNDLKIKQERKPTNFFTLTAFGASHKDAIEKVNTYAKALIQEYTAYRTNDLTQWKESLELRKKGMTEQLAGLDSEETMAKSKTGVVSPVETLTFINSLLSDQRHNYSSLSVSIANEEVKRKRLEGIVGSHNTAILKFAPQMRKKSQELAAIDAELAKLQEVYTDLNPKVLGKLDDRKKLMDEYVAMLKANGLEQVDLKEVERVEQAVVELDEVKQRMEVLAEKQRAIGNEIKTNETKSQVLTEAILVLQRINFKRGEIERNLREINEKLSDIDYLNMTASGDLHQIEMAGGARDKGPVNVKNLGISIGAALVCTMSLTFWILLMEFFFGKVRNSKELAAYDDILVLGSLPKPDVMIDEEKEKEIIDVVTLNFCNAELAKGIVLVCRLPGTKNLRKFFDELEWSLSMSGQRPFLLEVVQSQNFTPPEDGEMLINTVYKEARGWYPTASHYALAPTEIQMLKADLASLRENFDNIFILMPEGVRRGGNFFHQLLEVSETALLLVGARTTPRSALKYVRTQALDAKKQMMGLVAGAPLKEVQKEMELKHEKF